jgi:hypothetical protein
VVMLSSLNDRLRLPRVRRLRTAALPSASKSWASGVEHPSASPNGKELLRCRCVLGLGLSVLESEWVSLSIVYESRSLVVDSRVSYHNQVSGEDVE